MSDLQEEVFKDISGHYVKNLAASIRVQGKSIYQMIMDGKDKPDYYVRRKHGKWTIYDKDGWQIAGRLNEREMKNYMKLLKEK
jgi:hypothetical protein